MPRVGCGDDWTASSPTTDHTRNPVPLTRPAATRSPTGARDMRSYHTMGLQRIALIYDDRLRSDTTGVHVHRALAQLVEVGHFQPDQAQSIPSSGFDLYLRIDDDTDHRLPAALRPRAFWAI